MEDPLRVAEKFIWFGMYKYLRKFDSLTIVRLADFSHNPSDDLLSDPIIYSLSDPEESAASS